MPVVAQHHELVPRDEAIGGVAVDHVHLSGRQRLVLHGRYQRMHLAEVHAVRGAESGKPIRPADEIGRQPRREPGRGPGQITQGRQPVALRSFGSHGNGIGVLKAERSDPADAPATAELRGDAREHRLRVGLRGLAENRDEPGAGVLGIHVDGPGAKRLERNLGGAEPRAPRHRKPPGFEQLGKHLGQEIRLTKRLRRHDDGPGRRLGLKNGAGQQRQEGRPAESGAHVSARSSSRRTYSVAGSARNVSKGATCCNRPW